MAKCSTTAKLKLPTSLVVEIAKIYVFPDLTILHSPKLSTGVVKTKTLSATTGGLEVEHIQQRNPVQEIGPSLVKILLDSIMLFKCTIQTVVREGRQATTTTRH